LGLAVVMVSFSARLTLIFSENPTICASISQLKMCIDEKQRIGKRYVTQMEIKNKQE
jgi:predicted ATPase with chaperone activity